MLRENGIEFEFAGGNGEQAAEAKAIAKAVLSK